MMKFLLVSFFVVLASNVCGELVICTHPGDIPLSIADNRGLKVGCSVFFFTRLIYCFVATILQNGTDDTPLQSSLNKELEILFFNTWMITIRFAEVDPFIKQTCRKAEG